MPNPFLFFFPGFERRIGIAHHAFAMTCLLVSCIPFLYLLVFINNVQESFGVSVSNQEQTDIFLILAYLLSLACSGMMLSCSRLKDAGLYGGLSLLILLPIAGCLVLAILCLQPTSTCTCERGRPCPFP